MGAGSQIASVILRLIELISAAVVTGIVSFFFSRLHQIHGPRNGRLIYAEVTAVLGIVVSLVLFPPLKYSFYAWPLDLIMFIMWIVAFALLAALNTGCSAGWYWNYWGYYWGRWWNMDGRFTHNSVARSGCSDWRAVLAFLFIGAMAFLLSMVLGIGVWWEIRSGDRTGTTGHRSGGFREKRNHPTAAGVEGAQAPVSSEPAPATAQV